MKQYFEKAVKIRRDLHKKPELGWCEFCTTAYIVNELEAIGWKAYLGTKQISVDAVMGRSVPLVQKSIERAKREGVSDAMLDRMQGFTGCIAEWDTGRAGPVTAFRFDIDCVGVEETKSEDHLPNKLGFQSTYEGVMHSCGHDGHAAMGMALAHWIKDNSDRLCGKFKIIFQPAEEGVRGAAAQAASGLLDDVDNLFGAHLALVCKSGEICTYPTDVLATVKLDVKFTGKPAHPTMSPELGRNALACLSTCVSELLGMSRHSKGMSCINVGHIEAGEFRNVVPVHGLLQMEVRGATDEINNYMVDQAMRIIKGTALAYDVEYEITKAGEATALVNNEELVQVLTEVTKTIPECREVVREKVMGGSEDFTVLATRVQSHGGKAEFFILGSDRPGAHHQKNFDFDESSMNIGLKIYTGCIERLNHK